MTSTKRIALLVLLAVPAISVGPILSQQRKPTTYVPSYTPPAPRPAPRQESEPGQRRPAPQQSYPVNQNRYSPQNAQPSNRQSTGVQSENRQYASVRPESASLGANHSNVTISRPPVITAAVRHAMSYNSRPNGVHIRPDYFASHYGRANVFHLSYGGLIAFRGEFYFNFNGGSFGMIGSVPATWALAVDYLYIDLGDDGNYYLYDAQNPDVAVQITFVQNLGDDQTGSDQDQGDGSGQ